MTTRKRLPAWLTWLGRIALAFVLFPTLLSGILFWQQDRVVQEALAYANTSFTGQVTVAGSHISPFVNFPYLSIDLEGVKLYETKDETQAPLLDLKDLYLGLDLWSILSGNYELKALELRDGYLKFVQHPDGSFNVLQALTSPAEASAPAAPATQAPPPDPAASEALPLAIDLKKVTLQNVDVHKISEATDTDVDAYVYDAKARLKVDGDRVVARLDAEFEMNLMQGGDTTFVRHKHFDVQTEMLYDGGQQRLVLSPSRVRLETGEFTLEGKVDLARNQYVDLVIEGAKSNFDLLIAFAPEELIPTLKSYDNRGEVFFDARVVGELANGGFPNIEARFGCEDGLIRNSQTKRRLADLTFQGYLATVADSGGLAALEFGLKDFQAKPETGIFSGDLRVRNFLSPEIDLQLRSDFNLDFLTEFFNIDDFRDMSGSVKLTMNFHDIIDLNQPEKSIERLNESYFTELEIRDLNFTSEDFHLPVEDLHLIGHIAGHEAKIDTFRARIGRSDLFASGRVSDLPAIIHHTRDSVWVDLQLRSDRLDIAELNWNDSTQAPAVDEQISDLRLDLGFTSSAFAFTESPNLPVGEFFIRELHAQMQHYPHQLQDFRADLYIEDEDIRLIDFSGELDRSDFHFTGRLLHYDIWLRDTLAGDTELEFDLTSDHLYLEDLLVYRGENYVPPDYRHEEFENLKLHGRTALHFRPQGLQSIDLDLEELTCQMQLHDSKLDQFAGRLHYEDEHLSAENFRGRIGESDFAIDLYWYLGQDSALRREDHFVALRSERLNVNQLLAWNPPAAAAPAPAAPQPAAGGSAPAPGASTAQVDPVDHDAPFTIFDLPFWNMNLQADIGRLTYHQYDIQNLSGSMRMRSDRYLYLDSLRMEAAGGQFDISGYFDATDSSEIYLSPLIRATGVDLDRFMVKFDNFGQDYLVSENLHGRVNCDIRGKVHIHEDLTPMLDRSDFVIDLEVLDGRLDNYGPMQYLAEYFGDRNLNRVRFDTLRNTLAVKENVLTLPAMTVNSSLGFIELEGTQRLDGDMDMDLLVKVPLSLVTRAAYQKLFRRPPEEVDPEQEDAIQYRDADKTVAFTQVRLLANVNGYEVKLMK